METISTGIPIVPVPSVFYLIYRVHTKLVAVQPATPSAANTIIGYVPKIYNTATQKLFNSVHDRTCRQVRLV